MKNANSGKLHLPSTLFHFLRTFLQSSLNQTLAFTLQMFYSSSPYQAQCWGLLEGRRQHRGAFSRPSFQQSHRTKARAQCSGPSGKGIQRKEEQMPQQGLGEEPVSLRTLPQLSHLFMPTSPDSHHHMVAPLWVQPCHPKGRTPQPLGLQQAHRPLCQDTLPLSLHSANPLVIR